jgi:hypothetical protein
MFGIRTPMWLALGGTVLMTILLGVQSATSDGSVTDGQELIQISIGVVTAFGVWAAANLPGQTWIKTAVASALAALSILVTAILGGVNTGEIVNMAIAVLIALGVAVTTSPVTTVIAGQVRTYLKSDGPPRETSRVAS